MKDPGKRDWRPGVERLLAQPRDLERPEGELRWDAEPNSGSAEHRKLFKTYLQDLEQAVQEADADWNRRVDGWAKRWKNRDRALEHLWTERPAGPASHRDLIAVVRRYWLQCVALNKQVGAAERVAPETFVLSWVVAEGRDDEARVLAGMPYWPIGQDADGSWV